MELWTSLIPIVRVNPKDLGHRDKAGDEEGAWENGKRREGRGEKDGEAVTLVKISRCHLQRSFSETESNEI